MSIFALPPPPPLWGFAPADGDLVRRRLLRPRGGPAWHRASGSFLNGRRWGRPGGNRGGASRGQGAGLRLRGLIDRAPKPRSAGLQPLGRKV
ncbi:unnamed protein product [Rangifer tarandus platyrhynchus]|uniref:Uncharacterized protein n=2 Tax=Rangifer tarandus platyrhynchus TaxID=3082113 RepID=A0ACB0ENE5_RANTA|nr:unnamed protein product [Rangifer tarandus platyrhynchus]CAI9702205.1 unnamed protein product [Rangifer tarandus platyrhynchus]